MKKRKKKRREKKKKKKGGRKKRENHRSATVGRLRPKSLKRVCSVMPLWKQLITSCLEMLAIVARVSKKR
jgi:trimethylamine:corrinoid methyltransferase-like protein